MNVPERAAKTPAERSGNSGEPKRVLAAAVEGADLGLRRGIVELRSSSSRWAAAFGAVVIALEDGRPREVMAIEHIGSTAVPGLPAKPILDIAVGLRPGASRQRVHEWLLAAGMLYRGEKEDVRPDLMYGFELEPNVRLINVHVVDVDGLEWAHYLTFRDRLRANPNERDAYGALKQGLASDHPSDRHAYIDGKAAFILERREARPPSPGGM